MFSKISKAFDYVDYEKLLPKLKCYGFSSWSLKLFRSILEQQEEVYLSVSSYLSSPVSLYVYLSLSLSRSGRSEPSVVIIGAGIAGLSVAQRLAQCGLSKFTVLEATDR